MRASLVREMLYLATRPQGHPIEQAEALRQARRIVQSAITQYYGDERRHPQWVDLGGEG